MVSKTSLHHTELLARAKGKNRLSGCLEMQQLLAEGQLGHLPEDAGLEHPAETIQRCGERLCPALNRYWGRGQFC